MDRRTFLAGIGTAAVGATGGWATIESAHAGARASGLAKAAGASGASAAGSRAQAAAGATPSAGVATAMLQGDSAHWLGRVARGEVVRWAPLSTATGAMNALLRFAPKAERSVIVRVSPLRFAGSEPLLRSLDVTAHFALAEGGFAPFYASSFRAASTGRAQIASSPVAFDALTPDHAALQIDYALDERLLAANVSASGSVYLPIGATGGAGTGLFVVAAASRASGLAPDLSSYRFSGELDAPIVDAAGAAPDFDHLVLSVSAA